MATSDEEEKDVEFIDAKTNAEYRLACLGYALQAATAGQTDVSIKDTAQQYYDWVMDSEAEADPSAATPEDSCTPRRH